MSAYRTPAPQAAAETEGNVGEANWVVGALFVALGVIGMIATYASITGESECRRKHCDVGEPAWANYECMCVTRPK